MPLAFSLNYAAPELVLAQKRGAGAVTTAAAADVWALGVLAFELLSGRRTFSPGTPEKEIREMLAGSRELPWEREDPKQLRTLKHSVLACLAREPSARPDAAGVHQAWANLLDFAAVQHTTRAKTSP